MTASATAHNAAPAPNIGVAVTRSKANVLTINVSPARNKRKTCAKLLVALANVMHAEQCADHPVAATARSRVLLLE